jgi:DNA replication ATP-dependent helicase Dna2
MSDLSKVDPGKENQLEETGKGEGQQKHEATPIGVIDSCTVPGSSSKGPPPSTPATRLPLADLLGNPDDTQKRKALGTISPGEYVCWIPAPSPSGSQSRVTPARKRKRAKSSSPIYSSQNETSNFFPEGVTPARPPQAHKTPQIDPAVDLWNRYANANDPKGAVFSNQIQDTSPKSPATAGSVSGLRRWASCGIEWPTSRSKRRKFTSIIDHRPPDDQPHDQDEPRPSRVSELLERMKETLARPRESIPQGPSSSSPLPECGGTTDATSPLQRLAPLNQPPSRHVQSLVRPRTLQAAEPSQNSHKTSSDYGDIEVDMFDALDPVLPLQPRPSRTPAPSNVKEVDVNQGYNKAGTEQPLPKSAPAIAIVASDDFGDDDDDMFAADMEMLASRYDSQTVAQPAESVGVREVITLPSSTATPTARGDGDKMQALDEDFDDEEIDMDQFAAVEAIVSQAYQESGNAHVCGDLINVKASGLI